MGVPACSGSEGNTIKLLQEIILGVLLHSFWAQGEPQRTVVWCWEKTRVADNSAWESCASLIRNQTVLKGPPLILPQTRLLTHVAWGMNWPLPKQTENKKVWRAGPSEPETGSKAGLWVVPSGPGLLWHLTALFVDFDLKRVPYSDKGHVLSIKYDLL